MAKNSNLHNAKVAKNDDFFTQLSDIENELQHYWSHGVNHFEGKSVLMNCDNPKFSNFWVYFHKNFNKLKLTRIGAIHYSTSEPAYYKEYTGGDDFDITVGNETLLRGNGDFRSEECIEILKGYDMVVTNPPFSLLRPYIAQLMEFNKEFIIIGNTNAISYKEVFPLLRNNKLWIGCTNFNTGMYFEVSDDFVYASTYKFKREINGKKVNRVASCCWFTNIDIERRHDYMILSKEYTPEAYPKYDNYDAINVNKFVDIPIDYFESFIVTDSYLSNLDDTFTIYEDAYEMLDDIKNKVVKSKFVALNTNGEIKIPVNKDNKVKLKELVDKLEELGVDLEKAMYRTGVIGVPITFLGKHSFEQFEILGMSACWDESDIMCEIKTSNTLRHGPFINGKELYRRIFIKLINDYENKEVQSDGRQDVISDRTRNNDEATRQKADKLSNDLMKILSVPGAIKQELTYLRVAEDE